MEEEKKKRRNFLLISCCAFLVGIIGGLTYAFFNYTKTGSSNLLKVGRMNFVANQSTTISINNLFPIDPTETGIMDDNTKVGTLVISIQGDTDYDSGIEYLLSSVETNIFASNGKMLPLSLDISVNGLGNESTNYFTARNTTSTSIYHQIVREDLVGDGMLLVGYITPNSVRGTIEGVNGTITIKAYIDENKIAITDTYDGSEAKSKGTKNSWIDGRTVFTTNEWKELQTSGVSFKVKVEANEGIWVNSSIEEIMKKSAVMDNINSTYVNNQTPGIDFGNISSDTNGKGVYIRSGTENDTFPIMYYRGDVQDNNVYYANKCWKVVRTTETGGVKLIYNGEMTYNKKDLIRSDYGELVTNIGNFTFNDADNTWNATMTETVDESTPYELSFRLPVGKYYIELEGEIVTNNVGAWSEIDFYINNDYNDGIDFYSLIKERNLKKMYVNSNSDNLFKFVFYGEDNTNQIPSTTKIKIKKEDSSLGMSCDNLGQDAGISLLENQEQKNIFEYNINNNSLAYVGYMYGTVYEAMSSNWTSGARFGSDFTWNGTNYTLINDTVTTPDNTHHYSCNVTTSNGTCTNLRYVFSVYNNYKSYIVLQNGKSVEDAIQEMQTNTTSSNAKTKIDTWYSQNMINYTKELEDTIWCNERSFYENNSGWIPNGGNLNIILYFGAVLRGDFAGDDSPVKNIPTTACPNKNDAFTVNDIVKGNGALTYPISLLTVDEVVMSGSVLGKGNNHYYLNNNSAFYTLSPFLFNIRVSQNIIYSRANIHDDYNNSIDAAMVNYGESLRPSISIKPGMLIKSGTGTVIDPYVIE